MKLKVSILIKKEIETMTIKTSIKTFIQREQKVKEARKINKKYVIKSPTEKETFRFFEIEFLQYFKDFTREELRELTKHLTKAINNAEYLHFDDNSAIKYAFISFINEVLEFGKPLKSTVDALSRDYNGTINTLHWAREQARTLANAA